MRKSSIIIAIIVVSSILPMYVPSVKAVRNLPFTVGQADTPQNVDPANAYDSVSYNSLNQVYEGLYAYNLSSPEVEPIPQLAAKMGTWDSTNTNLTIELREDVTFHDGTPFDADVVKWNFDRLFYFIEDSDAIWDRNWGNYFNSYRLYLNNEGDPMVKETQVVDDFTIKFILNKPCIVWESMLAFTGSFIIKPNEAFREKFLNISDQAIGTGPFKLIGIEPDVSVEFERYEDYYKGPANITRMEYRVIGDGEVASTAMLNHELHYGGVISEHLDDAEADPDITIERVKTSVVFFLRLSVLNIPYEVRRAMAFAYDYPYYLEETLQGEAYELHTPIPAGMQYHNPDIEGLPYFNKTIARQYMLSCPNISAEITESGLNINSTDADWIAIAESDTPLFESNFTRYTSIGLEKILIQLIDNFKFLGIQVKDVHVGCWCWPPHQTNKKFLQITMGGWGPDYNDAINMIEPLYHTNATYSDPYFQGMGLENADLDVLISENYELTGDNRTESFDAIVKKLIVEICPAMYIYQRGGREVYNNRYVSNVQDMLNIFDNTYWYNVRYTQQEDKSIPGFPIGFLAINTILVVIAVVWKLRNLNSPNEKNG